MNTKHYYLIRVQFLGFRYSGWQKQPGVKTVEGMLHKTLKFILPKREFKILGAGRTDAKVSAMEAAFELYLKGSPLERLSVFLEEFNYNLPADIKLLRIDEVNEKFNIINDCFQKEYTYLFSHGSKNHPFAAPFVTGISEALDIELMKTGAELFEGTHYFGSYTTRDSKNKNLKRTIEYCRIVPNELLKANFFPHISYALIIRAQGFLRYQVRMIMGALLQLGKHEIDLETIKESLQPDSDIEFGIIAPASGLMLRSLDFQNKG